jgi:hypothetical protein
VKLSERQAIFASNVAKLITFIFSTGHKCTFGEAYRPKETAEIYAKDGRGILNSLHCDRLAIDINLFSKEGIYLQDTKSYEPFGEFWETLTPSNKWGGRFHDGKGNPKPDGNHFEMAQ